MSGNIQVGRRVLFIGGPEAGNARMIPDSYGDVVKAEGDFVYRIYPLRNGKDVAYFACPDGYHILNALVDMFREYAPAMQIKGDIRTYQSIADNNPAQ